MMDTTASLISTGLTVSVIGMTVVFVLLTALVYVIRGMSYLSARLSPPEPTGSAANQGAEAELISVITAAVSQYRARRDAQRGSGD